MKQQTYLHIPTPCHEDWNKMSDAEKGKFCNVCSKKVVDFTLMSDQEVLNYFSKTAGNTCGRFAADQLQRPLEPVKIEKKKSWWIAAMMPLLLFIEKSYGQRKHVVQSNSICTKKDTAFPLMGKVAPEIRPAPQEILVGKVVIAPPVEKIITGRIIDILSGDAIAFASVSESGNSYNGTDADSTGKFSLHITATNKKINLVVTSIGYKTKEIEVENLNEPLKIVLERKEILLPSVIVNAQSYTGRLGGLTCVIIRRSPVKDTIKRILNISNIKIFPNPAPSGSPLNIDVKKEGDYTIALFDNSGKLLLVKDFTAVGTTVTQIEMPSVLSAGMYYVMVTNKKTKKQESGKVVVE